MAARCDGGFVGHSGAYGYRPRPIVLAAVLQGVLNTHMLLNEYLDCYPLLLVRPGNI